MTIKRRLFISNILMIIIPVLLSLFVAAGMLLVFIGVTGDNFRDEDLFYRAIEQTDTLTQKWSQNNDFAQMKADVDNLNEQYSGSISLSIYQGKELLYPNFPFISNSVLDMALSQDGSHIVVIDNTAVYTENIGEYSVVLTDTNFQRYNIEAYQDYRNSYINYGILVFIVVIVIIMLTNQLLTRFVFKSIITPLDTLVYGVHQIRDGNLDYRIKYEGKDEFAGICSDFNEMAQRLLDSVNVKQKDEENRKELIAGISHDLRTPLTSIKAYVEGIEKGVASTPEIQKRYLDTIKNKTNDLEHIVNQLFLFSKMDIGEFPLYPEQVDIGKELCNLIGGVTEEYEKKGLAITLIENVQNATVKADPVQLRNAITNILENSVKYKNKELGEMKITCRADDNTVSITLKDNGPGVPSEALKKLFDVFYRGDPSRSNPSKGSGLGLAITLKILERQGGTIKAENVPEGGLAIVMTLPKYIGGNSFEKNFDY